jgi:hypothetical protein
MALRDYFIAPAPDAAEGPAPDRRSARSRFRRAGSTTATAACLGVLATPRDLAAVAAATGLVVARGAPAALVFVHDSGADVAAPLRAPARAPAARLAASLRARGVPAEARGRVTLAHAATERHDTATRALSAAGSYPTVLATPVRDPDVDELLARQDAILVALPPSVDAALAELALSGAGDLCRSATSVAIAWDPLSRALAVGGWRGPRVLREAVEGLLA